MHYLIDIVGTCNLRCPSCPVGNFKASDFLEKTRDKGFMDIELFRKIIDKIINESQRYGEDFSILLYNWGEAMLHPKIDEFANILQKLSIPFHMSSNLNTEAKFTQIVRAAATFRISVSGYSNETYQKGHVAGDINLVISNMYRIRYEIDRCKSAIQVSVFYHVYKENCDEKMINLARLSRDLGFQFGIGLAYFMPLEKVLAYTEKSPSFTENDRNTMDRMILSIDECLAIAATGTQHDCELRTGQTVINHDGSVPICCSTFDPIYKIAGNFLEVSREDLQSRKMEASICEKCMKIGAHNSAIYQPHEVFDAAMIQKQTEMRQRYLTRMFSVPQIIEAIYSNKAGS